VAGACTFTRRSTSRARMVLPVLSSRRRVVAVSSMTLLQVVVLSVPTGVESSHASGIRSFSFQTTIPALSIGVGGA